MGRWKTVVRDFRRVLLGIMLAACGNKLLHFWLMLWCSSYICCTCTLPSPVWEVCGGEVQFEFTLFDPHTHDYRTLVWNLLIRIAVPFCADEDRSSVARSAVACSTECVPFF